MVIQMSTVLFLSYFDTQSFNRFPIFLYVHSMAYNAQWNFPTYVYCNRCRKTKADKCTYCLIRQK